eukprot:1180727-Prorocentrum_minimum.AAC.1
MMLITLSSKPRIRIEAKNASWSTVSKAFLTSVDSRVVICVKQLLLARPPAWRCERAPVSSHTWSILVFRIL